MATTKKSDSTEIVPANDYAIMQTQVEDLREIIEANIGAQGLSRFDLDKIKVPAGGGLQFDIPTLDGEEQSSTYEGIIVHWSEPRAYWDVSFDESGGGSPPDCSSHNGVYGNGKFGPGSDANPTGQCETCPMSDWGSAGEGRRGQACKQMRVLFTVRPDTMLPDAVICPPTSIKPIRQYFLRLAGRRIPFYSVITRLELEREKSADGITYSKIVPKLGGRLEPEQVEQAKAYGQAIKLAVGDAMVDVLDEDLVGADEVA